MMNRPASSRHPGVGETPSARTSSGSEDRLMRGAVPSTDHGEAPRYTSLDGRNYPWGRSFIVSRLTAGIGGLEAPPLCRTRFSRRCFE